MTQPASITTQSPALSYVVIGGDRSPGLCVPRGFNSPRGWDERQGYGLSGATLVPKGNPLASGTLEFTLWDDAQFAEWYAFAAKYFAEDVRFIAGSRKPRALAVYHPALANPPLQYDEFVVDDCTQLEQDEESGAWIALVKLRRYRKPVPAPQPPVAAIPAAQQPQPTAQDAADRMIQELQAELQGLAQ